MQQWNYRIELLAPVLLTGTVGDETISLSENYISGTTLLGLFANQYLREGHSADSENFRKWFLQGGLRFLNGYAGVTEPTGKELRRSLPVPLSYQAEKTSPDNPVDVLLKDDQVSRKPVEGFIVKEGAHIVKAEIAKMVALHHARKNQLYGPGSEEGALFNYEYLRQGQTFMAAVVGEPGCLKDFQYWISEQDKERVFRIGRSRNTEYGLVNLDWLGDPGPISEPGATFKFEDDQIILTFLSHVIILNDLGQSDTSEKNLLVHLVSIGRKHKVDLTKSGLEIASSLVRTAEIENYVTIWKARKPAQRAFRMGSAFLLTFDAGWLKEHKANLIALFAILQEEGIGCRRQEGFGRIIFGWQQEQSLVNDTRAAMANHKKNMAQQPPIETSGPSNVPLNADMIAGAMNEKAKELLRDGLKNRLLEKIRAAAHDLAADFAKSGGGGSIRGKTSQLNRLLQFLAAAKGENEFLVLLGQLKDPGRKALSGISLVDRNRKQHTLLDLLLNHNEADSVNKQIAACLHDNFREEILAILGNPLDEGHENFRNTAYKEFLRTLFTSLIKRAKQEESL